jgi:hypothetical protein
MRPGCECALVEAAKAGGSTGARPVWIVTPKVRRGGPDPVTGFRKLGTQECSFALEVRTPCSCPFPALRGKRRPCPSGDAHLLPNRPSSTLPRVPRDRLGEDGGREEGAEGGKGPPFLRGGRLLRT